jgi:flagellin-like hook-associated protein FlgL
MFGQIESLVRKIDYSSMKAERSIKKVASTGDPVRQASLNNQGAGSVNMTANLEQEKRYKRGSLNAFQNAMTYMQAQAEAIGQADKIYSRMRTLAQQATDPMINDQDRALLSDQFDSLMESAHGISRTKFNGNLIFDPLAASTTYPVTFGDGQLRVLNKSTDVPDDAWDDPNNKQWYTIFEEKDVLYNKGKMIIDVNGGGDGEQYTLWQGNQKIFDTGIWKTNGSAWNWDYDRFIVEFGPEQTTTFQFVPLSPGDSSKVDSQTAPGYPDNLTDNLVYDNKSNYLSQLGLSDDGTASGLENVSGQKYTQKGQVFTTTINSDSSILRLQVYSKSITQVKGSFELPDLEDEIVARDGDLQVTLKKLGLGLLLEKDSVNLDPISIDTYQNAEKAIVSMTSELEGLGEQLGVLASNVSRVQNAIQTNEGLEGAHESVLSEIGAENFTQDLLELSKARINRAQDTALLTQAMSIHQDLVNVLI